MKKLLILSISLFLSACACMNSDEPQETEIVYRNTQSVHDCDYLTVRPATVTAMAPAVILTAAVRLFVIANPALML